MIVERFRSGVRIVDGRIGGEHNAYRMTIPHRYPELVAMCKQLSTVGIEEHAAGTISSDPEQIAACLHFRERFRALGWIEWVLYSADKREVAVFEPLEYRFRPGLRRDIPAPRLSRFSYIKRDGNDLVLVSPETPCRATLPSEDAVNAIWNAAKGLSRGERETDEFFVALDRFGFLESGLETDYQTRASWTFEDAVFHTASRRGRDEPIVGENTDLKKRFSPPGKQKAIQCAIRLAIPQVDAGHAIEHRKSFRNWRDKPVDLFTLSAFLYSIARIRKEFVAGGLERMDKPIPSAGSIHELEWYVVPGTVQGLDIGLYRYCAGEHGLQAVPNSTQAAIEMLSSARNSLGVAASTPPVLIVLTTRMSRIAWQYKGMAYRLTLLDAGVAIHAMYLAAESLGLGGCAIGTGDPRPFHVATGYCWFEETPVAEFAMGLPD